jgi:fructose/tagatose bisphosphate aldolase
MPNNSPTLNDVETAEGVLQTDGVALQTAINNINAAQAALTAAQNAAAPVLTKFTSDAQGSITTTLSWMALNMKALGVDPVATLMPSINAILNPPAAPQAG